MKTAVVTGSQSGMGLAIRTELESKGWRVRGIDLPGKGAEVEGDLSTEAGREGAAPAIIAASGGRLDAVAANAGVDVPRPGRGPFGGAGPSFVPPVEQEGRRQGADLLGAIGPRDHRSRRTAQEIRTVV
jgi:NAD(P)-dependent dehydrogenase (short-subunit alcohol dehydrogenase family)